MSFYFSPKNNALRKAQRLSLPSTCSIDNCSKKPHAKSYCNSHYAQYLRNGSVRENTRKNFNKLIDKGTYFEIILTDIKYREVGRAKFDKEDLHKIKSCGRWGLSSDGYVENSTNKISMHRLVMDAGKNQEVDHKETSVEFRLDNRKNNLRLCNKTQNRYNQSKYKNNKSGYKGVSRNLKSNKWQADIKVNGKTKYLGQYDSPTMAYKAYCDAANNLQGNFIHKSIKKAQA